MANETAAKRELIPYGPIYPIGGLNQDEGALSINLSESPFLWNIVVNKDSIEKRTGITLFGDNLPLETGQFDMMLIKQFHKQAAGAFWLIAASTHELFTYSLTTKDWTAITGAFSFSGTLDNPIFAETIDDKFIITNLADEIQVWDGTGNIAALSDTAPKAMIVRKYKNFLFALHLTVGADWLPQRMAWTAIGDPETWPADNFYDLVGGTDRISRGSDWITGAETLGDSLIIYKEHSIIRCSWIGGPVGFFLETIRTDIGTPAGKTVSGFQGKHIFLGQDNVYILDGTSVVPVGDKIIDELIAASTPGKLNRSWALMMPENYEWWVFVATQGSETPNRYWCYNWRRNTWTTGHLNALCGSAWTKATSPTWDELVGSWNVQRWRWDDKRLLANSPTYILGQTDGNIVEYGGIASKDLDDEIGMWCRTKDMDFGRPELNKTVLELEFYATGDQVYIQYSIDGGRTWEGGKWITLDSPSNVYKFYLRVTCRRIMFMFSLTSAQIVSSTDPAHMASLTVETGVNFELWYSIPHYYLETERIRGT